MKTQRAKWDYSLPPVGRIEHVVYDEGVREMRGNEYPMLRIDFFDLRERHLRAKTGEDAMLGRPMYYAVEEDKLYVFPAPVDDVSEIKVVYFPPLQVL